MTFEKISIALDQEIAGRVRRAAELEGLSLSGWLTKTVGKAAGLVEARAAWKEYCVLFGEPDPEAVKEMDRKLEEAGFWREETPEERTSRLAALASLRGWSHYKGNDLSSRMTLPSRLTLDVGAG